MYDLTGGAMQRTLSGVFRVENICTADRLETNRPKPYAYIAYEREDRPGSTGEVIYFADSPGELAQRAKIARSTVYEMLARSEAGDTSYAPYLPFIIKKVYLA